MQSLMVQLSAGPKTFWQNLSRPMAASTSEGLSSALFMNLNSRPFGPQDKIQTFLLGV